MNEADRREIANEVELYRELNPDGELPDCLRRN